MKNKLASTLVGVAGEYLVAGELSLRGYIASITLRNSKGIDEPIPLILKLRVRIGPLSSEEGLWQGDLRG